MNVQFILHAYFSHPYNKVFYAPVWLDIFENDTERRENIEQVIEIDKKLKEAYKNSGYIPIELPKTNIKERVRFILSELNYFLFFLSYFCSSFNN